MALPCRRPIENGHTGFEVKKGPTYTQSRKLNVNVQLYTKLCDFSLLHVAVGKIKNQNQKNQS